MEYIDKLRESIKNNPNLSEEFKCNLGTLTDTIVTILPEYDYSKLDTMVSNLKVSVDENIDSYSSYDKESNTIKLNTNKVFEDRIDVQHLFLNELLLRSNSDNDKFKGFNVGVSEAITTTMNCDDSMVKLNSLEYTLMSIFSKIIDGKTIIDSFMKDDITNVAVELESFGITSEEFMSLLSAFNTIHTNGDSFANAETLMINMYGKKVNYELSNGLITYDDIGNKYDDLGDMLIYKRSELIYLYPHHDFSNLTNFEIVKDCLDKTISMTEEVKENSVTK